MKKRMMASLMLAAMLAAGMTGCSNEQADGQDNLSVSDVSDDEVLMTEPLAPINYEEGDLVENEYYKRGSGSDGTACYFVQVEGQEGELEIPMDNTVIYQMEEGEPYIEQVKFSYTDNETGETVEQEQYRIYVVSSSGDEAASSSEESAE